nr:uncharacterized protein LOC122271384 [Parasteatoda tepidariorum]
MMGENRGVGAYLKENHSNLLVFGCLCHLINLAAEKGAKTLPISFDDLLIDIYYYFHRSGKRKLEFKKFQMFDKEGGKEILKHCATRWLSLDKCITRLLEQWRSLLLYFKEVCSESKVTTDFSPKISAFVIPKLQKQQTNEDVQTEGEGSKIKNTKHKVSDTTSVCSKKMKSKQKIKSNDEFKQGLKTKVSQENLKKFLG